MAYLNGMDEAQCDVCGVVAKADPGKPVSISEGVSEWKWFTGNQPTTMHCCPKCLKSNYAAYKAAFDQRFTKHD